MSVILIYLIFIFEETSGFLDQHALVVLYKETRSWLNDIDTLILDHCLWSVQPHHTTPGDTCMCSGLYVCYAPGYICSGWYALWMIYAPGDMCFGWYMLRMTCMLRVICAPNDMYALGDMNAPVNMYAAGDMYAPGDICCGWYILRMICASGDLCSGNMYVPGDICSLLYMLRVKYIKQEIFSLWVWYCDRKLRSINNF